MRELVRELGGLRLRVTSSRQTGLGIRMAVSADMEGVHLLRDEAKGWSDTDLERLARRVKGAFEDGRGPSEAEILGGLRGLADEAAAAQRAPEAADPTGGGHRTQAQVLVDLATDAELFHAPDGQVYATIPVGCHRETWPVRAKGFRRWLVRRFYDAQGKPPGAQALADALGLLEARAQFDGPEHPVFVRVAGLGSAIYLDLADDTWAAIEVTPEGWRVIPDPPVRFRRPRGLLALPHPVPGSSIEELRPFVNVPDEAAWHLVVAWLIAALRPMGPFPILIEQGEQGSGKSSQADRLRTLIDPSTVPLRTIPREERDLMISATNGWILSFDNLSALPVWLSDALCRLATGGGFATRELYSDADEALFAAMRPIILNGIDDLAIRPDLTDRALIVTLPQIPDENRRAEEELRRDFEAARPRILGALLNAASTGLKNLPQVRISALPRMADFALWATAAEPALGWPAGAFLAAYSGNRQEVVEWGLEASPVAQAVLALAGPGLWIGTASKLLEVLTARADEGTRKQRAWPTTARGLSNALRRLAPNLRAAGVEVNFEREPGGSRRRLVSIRTQPQLSVPIVPDASRQRFASPPGTQRDGRDEGIPTHSASTPMPRQIGIDAAPGDREVFDV